MTIQLRPRRFRALAPAVSPFIAGVIVLLATGNADAKPRRILLFTKSSGFEHSVIKKPPSGPSHAEGVLGELAKKNGWTVVHSKDGSLFTPTTLAGFDAYVLVTTGDLTTTGTDRQPAIPADGKAALIDAVARGKGLVGVHCASDTFHSAGPRRQNDGANTDPFIKLLGGEFISHGDQQPGKLLVVDPKFPGLASVKNGFELPQEEWYSLKNLADDMHAVLVLDTTGMKNPDYQRPNFPVAWARNQGKGRVFYTALGHREDVWTNPVFQDHLVGGLRWAMGDAKADVRPNKQAVAPQADVMPPPKPPTPPTAAGPTPASSPR